MLKKFNLENQSIIETQDDNPLIYVYVNPDSNEANELSIKHDIDKHTVDSALDPDEISRIEIDNGIFYIIWKRPKNYISSSNLSFEVSSMGLFLLENKLIIILPDDVLLFQGKSIHTLNDLWDIILYLLFNSIRHFVEHIKVIHLISRELQVKINSSLENEYLIQMFNITESLIYYLNAISANKTILIKLEIYFKKAGWEERLELIDDILIENNQCLKQAEIYSNVLSGLMDARGSIVNNNMNILIKKLTIINIIFLPLNLIAGIGGMSEYTMMTGFIDWKISYGIFILFMIIIGFITLKMLNNIFYKKPFSSRKQSSLIGKFRNGK